MKLIDQARTEANNWRKKYENTTRKQNDRIQSLQNNLIKLQDKLQDNLTAAQAAVNHKNDMIGTLNKQLEKMQGQHTKTVSELAVMKSVLKKQERKKSNKKQVGAV